jgi:cobalt-precorrin-5B (C1)-methyltransferase
MQIVEEEGLNDIWQDMAEKAAYYCRKTAHEMADVAVLFLDGKNQLLARSSNTDDVLNKVLKSK